MASSRGRALLAFAIGFVVFGGLDSLYTWAGGQSYSARLAPVSVHGWPVYVPFQMGLAALVVLAGWSRLSRGLPEALRREPLTTSSPWRAIGASLAPLVFGLALAFVLLDHPAHGSAFVALTMLSVLALAIGARRIELVAFALVGIAGPAAEWALLDPRLDYWRFVHTELFERLPAWEPFVYGWVGVTIHRISERPDA